MLSEDPEKGWFGRDAQKAMPTFVDDFICDPGKPYYGFGSWDDFLTRPFHERRRPVAFSFFLLFDVIVSKEMGSMVEKRYFDLLAATRCDDAGRVIGGKPK